MEKLWKLLFSRYTLLTLVALSSFTIHAYPAYNFAVGVNFTFLAKSKNSIEAALTSSQLDITDSQFLTMVQLPLVLNIPNSFFKFEVFLNRNHTVFASYRPYPPLGAKVPLSIRSGNTKPTLINVVQPHGVEFGYTAVFPVYRNFEFRVGTSLMTIIQSFSFSEQSYTGTITEIINEPVFSTISWGGLLGTNIVLSKRYRIGVDVQFNVNLYEANQLHKIDQSEYGTNVTADKLLEAAYTPERLFNLSGVNIYASILFGRPD